MNNLYKYLIGVAAILAVIEIVWGGLEISTKDSVSKQSDGKERITQAILGLILVLSPVLVFSIINPSILNLSVNLKKIDLTTPAWGGGTIVAPVSSGNLLAPNGTLMACPNNDCLAADTACRQQGVNGAVVTPSVVCMIGGNIDTQGAASLGADSLCPSGETKWIQCVTTPIVVPMP
ncbi:MAG: hypothetical protein KGJ31_03440 [Patescibacteria group bacterium]|nr:hypothetical protein [Patescibacteria group bacterium]